MQARYYDPVIGRFYSNDPMSSTSHVYKGNIHGFNRYTYANNNPYKYIDPDGKEGVGIRQDIRVKAFSDGELASNEYRAQHRAEAVGGLVAVALIATKGAVALPIIKKLGKELKEDVFQEVAAQVLSAAIEIAANSQGIQTTNPMQDDGGLNGNRKRTEDSSQSIAPETPEKKAETELRPKPKPKRKSKLGTRIKRF